MKKFRILLTTIAILVCGGIYAQNDEFYSEIKSFMTEGRSEYDSIFETYLKGGELSMDDYTLLYYGYTFTDAYQPNYGNNKPDSLISMKKYDEAYAALKDELRRDPTSLQTLFDLINIADILEKASESELYQKHYINMVQAIIQASGDGKSRENAIRVNQGMDELQILTTYFKAASIVTREFAEDYIDKITIKDSNGVTKEVYFDFSRYVEILNAQ